MSRTVSDSPKLWTHKIEQWKTVPDFPIRISTHGRVETIRKHNFGISKRVIAPIDDGVFIKYTIPDKGIQYSFAAHKLVADAFINPPAIGQVINVSGNYRDVSVFNLKRNWWSQYYPNVPREIVYFIQKIVKEETNLYEFYFAKNIENIKKEFELDDNEIKLILNDSIKNIERYETAFDKFTSYSPFIEQYYWTVIAYLVSKGYPRPPIYVRSLSTWGGVQSCVQFVEKNFGKVWMEWSNKVRERFPELWGGPFSRHS